MIVVDGVYKRYQTKHGAGPWVLRDVSFVIPKNVNVGLIGANGAGKSTLLRLIGGVDQPTRGRVERHCRVSWPMGLSSGLLSSLTGRQNAKFACRVNGHESDMPEKLASIYENAGIGSAFDEPVSTYSSGMKARLKFAISIAFDFDVYITDELTAVGDKNFKNKTRTMFADMVGRAGLIMVSHTENLLMEFCTAGILLRDGRAEWFDDIKDAFAVYKQDDLPEDDESAERPNDKLRGELARNAMDSVVLDMLEEGRAGNPVLVDHLTGRKLLQQASEYGIELLTRPQIAQRGGRLADDAVPLLRKRPKVASGRIVDFYDFGTQGIKNNTDMHSND